MYNRSFLSVALKDISIKKWLLKTFVECTVMHLFKKKKTVKVFYLIEFPLYYDLFLYINHIHMQVHEVNLISSTV